MNKRPKPIALIILDGWGYSEHSLHNAIAAAHTPCWDFLWKNYPHCLIEGSGNYVGLPDGQMGNSEVGHLNLGAGRIVYQDIGRINLAIENEEFFVHPLLNQAISQAKRNEKAIHILGLLSPGGIHSHENHIFAIIELLAEKIFSNFYIHAFLDGRDTPPQSAAHSLSQLEDLLAHTQCGKIASIIGRYYAMDRDNRWERIEKAYCLLTEGHADYHVTHALDGLEAAYARGESDEFIKATAIHPLNQPAVRIKEGDCVIFMNFRADRARQLTQAFISKNFTHFTRNQCPHLAEFITLTHYADNLPTKVLFPPVSLDNVMGEVLSKQGLKQLRIAETEKYAHVTFFFNGGREQPFEGETRILVPSPKVATYDQQPEMSALSLTEKLVSHILQQDNDVIICNFANPDMVGHTGNIEATIKAIEIIDQCLGQLLAALKQVGGEMLITADHGNAELMFDEQTHQPHTAHTTHPVPLIYYGRKAETVLTAGGSLADVAPTLLYLLGINSPKEMTGHLLFKLI